MKVELFKKLVKECVKEAIKEINEEITQLETTAPVENAQVPLRIEKISPKIEEKETKHSLPSNLQEALQHTRESLTSESVRALRGGASSGNTMEQELSFTAKDAKHFPHESTTPVNHSSNVSKLEADMLKKSKAIFGHLKDTNKLGNK